MYDYIASKTFFIVMFSFPEHRPSVAGSCRRRARDDVRIRATPDGVCAASKLEQQC